jgi:hypothetical protein
MEIVGYCCVPQNHLLKVKGGSYHINAKYVGQDFKNINHNITYHSIETVNPDFLKCAAYQN